MKNKIAIITGASQGIGKATAIKLDKEGLFCILVARDAKKLKETAKLLSGRAMIFPADVSNRRQIEALVAKILKKFHRIDILINNAGVALKKEIEDIREEEFNQLVNTNLRGTFNCSQAVIKQMKVQKSGQIINISALIAKKPVAGRSVHSATKSAVAGFGACLFEEVRKFGIKMATVYPGLVANERLLSQGEEAYRKFGNIDLALKPEDIAHAIWMIISQGKNSNISEVIVDNFQL